MATGDITLVHAASGTFTITLASLASSSTRVAGRESAALTFASIDPLIDVLVGGKITTGTSPTASRSIDIWVYAAVEDDPIYPDVFDGTDSDETCTSENVRNSALRLLATILVDAASDRTYWLAPTSIAALYGGMMPTHFGLFIAHDTAVALNATGSNHAFYYTPIYANVAS